jgi:2-polyprenyl-3-methyl-5-hydroxy-6-metoxy-1,4-benzoquinol methylase
MSEREKSVECLLCGSTAQILEKEFAGYMEPQRFEIWHCNDCDTSFSFPQVGNQHEIYDLIYRNIKEIPNYYRYWHYAENVKNNHDPLDFLCEHEQSYWGIKMALFKILKAVPDSRVLEIGCGFGYLTFALNRAGLNVKGIDISEGAINYAIAKFGDYYSCVSLNEYAETNPARYDIIVMTEVLEHLNDIPCFMKIAKQLLTSDGKLILTTPDKSAFDKISNWCTDLPPVHSWWLSRRSIERLGDKLSMKVTFVNFREFYRNKPEIIKLATMSMEKPIFDQYGMLKRHDLADRKTLKKPGVTRKFKRLFGDKIYYFLKRLYYSTRSDFVVFGERGFSTCAILWNK